MTLEIAFFDSPLGRLAVAAEAGALTAVHLPGSAAAPELAGAVRQSASPLLREAVQQLEEYFAGRRREFDLPLEPRGTVFQREVWAALAGIPFGTTTSYGAVARAIGRPRAVRAVGAANGKNPLAIILPCHRVIGTSGALTGYGGGLPAKRWLLAHEAGILADRAAVR